MSVIVSWCHSPIKTVYLSNISFPISKAVISMIKNYQKSSIIYWQIDLTHPSSIHILSSNRYITLDTHDTYFFTQRITLRRNTIHRYCSTNKQSKHFLLQHTHFHEIITSDSYDAKSLWQPDRLTRSTTNCPYSGNKYSKHTSFRHTLSSAHHNRQLPRLISPATKSAHKEQNTLPMLYEQTK